MALNTPLQVYARSPQPPLKESQQRYLQEELRKLEQTLLTVVDAIKELEARITALEAP